MATHRWAIGLALLAIASTAEAQLSGPPCSNFSYWGENFYQGATILARSVVPDVTTCCRACSNNVRCLIYTFCPEDQSSGCTAPNGPYARQTFQPGTCILSSYVAADDSTLLVWNFRKPGTPWAAGEYTKETPTFVADATGVDEDYEVLSSDGRYLCRKISGGTGQMAPVNVTATATGPVVDGQQVVYTGLIYTDPATNSTAGVIIANDTKTIWSYPTANLAYCDAPTPGCTPGPAGGRTEQGASCQADAECCEGLVCRPRGVSAVGLLYRSANGTDEIQGFKMGDSTLRPLLPNECVQLDTRLAEAPAPSGLDLEGPRYERPTYLSVPISYCLYFNSNCTGLEAANYFCANVTTSLLGTSYTAAVDFSAPVPVPPDADPRAVSTVSPAFNITCSSHYADCSTFEWITCA